MSRRRISAAVLAGSTALALTVFAPLTASATPDGEQVHYTVIAEDGVSAADAAAAISRAGGTIVSHNDDVGMFSVTATSDFAQCAIDAPELIGATADRAIGEGQHDPSHPGLRLDPAKVESLLLRTAAEHACPEPPLVSYANEGRPAEFNALCEGSLNFNGFYGYGIVDAFAAVTAPPAWDEAP